jgi:hypothetical protein
MLSVFNKIYAAISMMFILNNYIEKEEEEIT